MNNKIVAVSGGFDPLHCGHISLFKEAAKHGKLIVILNSDEWLLRKKGFFFQSWEDRADIIKDLRMVTGVVRAKDGDNSVIENLKELKPTYFCNGGDRILGNTPENEICEQLGIKTLYSIGGSNKYANSSHIATKNKVSREWGHYFTLDFNDKYAAKKIVIHPKESISLQKHCKRTETWFVIHGNAGVIVGESFKQVSSGDVIQIKINEIHKITNLDDNENLIIFEVQLGSFISESDIYRFDVKLNK